MVQWFPGHMVKARRILQENIDKVDVIVEILDARIPISSQNPIIEELTRGKKRLIVLNKADMADPSCTKRWINYYQSKGVKAIAVDSLGRSGIDKAITSLEKIPIDSKLAKKLNLVRPVRAMVVGIPNVGKSMFINALVRRSSAKTGNKPGLTRGTQWINLRERLQLLDTPGILWPKIEDEQSGIHLAFVNAIGPRAFDVEEIAFHLIFLLLAAYPDALLQHYQLSAVPSDPHEAIEQVGRQRGMLMKGGTIDQRKTSELFLKDFRDGRFGRITLEFPLE